MPALPRLYTGGTVTMPQYQNALNGLFSGGGGSGLSELMQLVQLAALQQNNAVRAENTLLRNAQLRDQLANGRTDKEREAITKRRTYDQMMNELVNDRDFLGLYRDIQNPERSFHGRLKLLQDAKKQYIDPIAKRYGMSASDAYKDLFAKDEAYLKSEADRIQGLALDAIPARIGLGATRLYHELANILPWTDEQEHAQAILKAQQEAEANNEYLKEQAKRASEGEGLWSRTEGLSGWLSEIAESVPELASFLVPGKVVTTGARLMNVANAARAGRMASMAGGAGLGGSMASLGYAERVLQDPNLTEQQKQDILNGWGHQATRAVGSLTGALAPDVVGPVRGIRLRLSPAYRAADNAGREAMVREANNALINQQLQRGKLGAALANAANVGAGMGLMGGGQQLATNIAFNAATGRTNQNSPIMSGVWDSALSGAITGGLLGAGSGAHNRYVIGRQNAALQAQQAQQAALAEAQARANDEALKAQQALEQEALKTEQANAQVRQEVREARRWARHDTALRNLEAQQAQAANYNAALARMYQADAAAQQSRNINFVDGLVRDFTNEQINPELANYNEALANYDAAFTGLNNDAIFNSFGINAPRTEGIYPTVGNPDAVAPSRSIIMSGDDVSPRTKAAIDSIGDTVNKKQIKVDQNLYEQRVNNLLNTDLKSLQEGVRTALTDDITTKGNIQRSEPLANLRIGKAFADFINNHPTKDPKAAYRSLLAYTLIRGDTVGDHKQGKKIAKSLIENFGDKYSDNLQADIDVLSLKYGDLGLPKAQKSTANGIEIINNAYNKIFDSIFNAYSNPNRALLHNNLLQELNNKSVWTGDVSKNIETIFSKYLSDNRGSFNELARFILDKGNKVANGKRVKELTDVLVNRFGNLADNPNALKQILRLKYPGIIDDTNGDIYTFKEQNGVYSLVQEGATGTSTISNPVNSGMASTPTRVDEQINATNPAATPTDSGANPSAGLSGATPQDVGTPEGNPANPAEQGTGAAGTGAGGRAGESTLAGTPSDASARNANAEPGRGVDDAAGAEIISQSQLGVVNKYKADKLVSGKMFDFTPEQTGAYLHNDPSYYANNPKANPVTDLADHIRASLSKYYGITGSSKKAIKDYLTTIDTPDNDTVEFIQDIADRNGFLYGQKEGYRAAIDEFIASKTAPKYDLDPFNSVCEG